MRGTRRGEAAGSLHIGQILQGGEKGFDRDLHSGQGEEHSPADLVIRLVRNCIMLLCRQLGVGVRDGGGIGILKIGSRPRGGTWVEGRRVVELVGEIGLTARGYHNTQTTSSLDS